MIRKLTVRTKFISIYGRMLHERVRLLMMIWWMAGIIFHKNEFGMKKKWKRPSLPLFTKLELMPALWPYMEVDEIRLEIDLKNGLVALAEKHFDIRLFRKLSQNRGNFFV